MVICFYTRIELAWFKYSFVDDKRNNRNEFICIYFDDFETQSFMLYSNRFHNCIYFQVIKAGWLFHMIDGQHFIASMIGLEQGLKLSRALNFWLSFQIFQLAYLYLDT